MPFTWNPVLTDLITLLARLYPDRDKARLAVREAGLDPDKIELTGPPPIFWMRIVEEANRRDGVWALLGLAREDFPNVDFSAVEQLLRQPNAAPRDSARTAGPQARETDPGFSMRTTSAPRRRPFLPLFVLGVLAFAAVGVLVWRTWLTDAPVRKGVVADDQRIEDSPKAQAEADERVKAGRAALDRGDFATALEHARAALLLVPVHAGATALHTEAAAQAGTAAQKDTVAKLLRAGREALLNRRFDDAVRAADEALKILPADKEATDLRAEAEAGLAADALARKRVEAAMLVASGRKALAEQNIAAAEKAAEDALQLLPGDPAAQALQAEVQTAKATAAALQKKRDDAANLVALGKIVLDEKRYDDARAAAEAALKLVPGHKGATELLAAIDARRKQDEAARLVLQGRAALREMKFNDARKAAKDALALVPQHPDALALLREADAAELVAAGQTAYKQGRFAAAAKFADDALKLLPGDAAAQALKKAASEPSPIGRWVGDNDSMGLKVKMDLRIAEGGTWVITVSGAPPPWGKHDGQYEMLGDKKISLTFNHPDGKAKKEQVTYTLTEDMLVMPNPFNLSEELKFKRGK